MPGTSSFITNYRKVHLFRRAGSRHLNDVLLLKIQVLLHLNVTPHIDNLYVFQEQVMMGKRVSWIFRPIRIEDQRME
jgi:hypothetical protein